MEASRSRKKKAGWQLTLGLKEAVFAGLGIAGLMMMAFALGALAGRGDIYRVAYQWGLLAPEAQRGVQWTPPGAAPPAPAADPAVAAAPAASKSAPAAVAAKSAPAAPVAGTLAAVPSAPAQKKTKSGPLQVQKAKEEEMRQLRQDVVRKLKFQNSFDTATAKPATPTPKKKPKEGDKAAAVKSPPSQVKVAQFRDSKGAKAKVAELQKKGIKASVKEGKDAKGPLFTVYKPGPAAADSSQVAQKPKPKKSAGKKSGGPDE
jgi:hypothetical protein